MESFWNWKWLMHANARALFFIALLILLLVLGWCAWVVWHPLQPANAETGHTTQPVQHAEKVLGILNCLSNELAVGAQVVPVNPFRPTLESLAASREPMTNLFVRTRTRGNTNDDPFAAIRGHRNVPTANTAQPAAPRIPKLTYLGYFQRPDGKTAALFRDSTTPAPVFHLPGDEFHGVALLTSGGTQIRVRLPGGQERALAVGESFELPAEAQP